MAIVIENQATPDNGAATFETGRTPSFGFTATANRLLIAALHVTRNNNSARIPAVPSGWSDGGASGWSFRGQTRVVYKVAAGGESSLTWALASGDGLLGSMIWEVSGIDTSTPYNQGKVGAASSGTSFTATAAGANGTSDALVFLAWNVDGKQVTALDSLTSGYGNTQFDDNGATSSWTQIATAKICTADETPSCTPDWTSASSGPNGYVMTVFNGAGGGGGGGVTPDWYYQLLRRRRRAA